MITASLAALLACAIAAADRIEVSDDGLEVTSASALGNGRGSAVAGAAGVPYGLVPDWANSLRRQVGGLQVADLNGDRLPDVVAGIYSSNSFPPYKDWHNLIYFNTGTELEASPGWISTDQVSTGDIQVGFINGDAYPDVFAANGGFSMDASVIYFGGPGGPAMAPGWFSAEPGAAWNNYALLFDLDHDGDTDVITANQGNSTQDPYRPMFMFRNDGGVPGTVPVWQSAETSIQNFLAAGDLDGDGWQDIAVSKWANFESGVYRVIGGALQTVPFWTTLDTDTDKGVGWADVDGNGRPDLSLGHDPTLLYSNFDGVLTATWSATAAYFGHSELRFHDVDGDGDQDLAEVHFGNGQVHIYLNRDGVLDSAPSWTWDSTAPGTAIAFGDIDGNGRDDLVVGNSGEPSIFVFYAEDFPPCPGDGNGDGAVDTLDFLALLAAWGTDDPTWDLVPDGVVDTPDFLALLAAWGPCR